MFIVEYHQRNARSIARQMPHESQCAPRTDNYVTLQKNGKNSTRIRDKHLKIVNSAQI